MACAHISRIRPSTAGAVLLLAVLALVPSSAWAQGFNLDFRGTLTGLPETYGAASGQTGTWVDVPLGVTNGLTDVSGATTGVSITTTGTGDTFHPATTDDGILLRDSIVNDGVRPPTIAFSATLTGLADGEYTVYYYHFAATSGLTINSSPMSDLAGGSADALGAQGTNWDAVQVSVAGGTLQIVDTTPESDFAGLSGIQMVRTVPEPASWLMLVAGTAFLGLLYRRRARELRFG